MPILEYTRWEDHLTILKKNNVKFEPCVSLSFLPRSSSLCHTGLWPSRPSDWCSDPNLWRPGFFVHRHLDTGGGGGWPQAGGGHRHQHPLPHSAWPAATARLQVHEGLYFALNSCRMADLMFWAFQFQSTTMMYSCLLPTTLRSLWLGAMAAPMLGQRSH